MMYLFYIELVEKLCGIVLGGYEKKVIFLNLGVEVVENVVKIFRKYIKC